MKQEDLQAKARAELSALNIIGIRDVDALRKARSEKKNGVSPEGIPSKDIPFKDTPVRENVRILSNFIKLDADIDDKAIPTMDTYEQSIYRKLYRDSYGGHPARNWCTVGYSTLERCCNMKKTGVKNALERLERNGWIKEIAFDRANGKTYRIYLPFENGYDSKTRVEGVSPKGIASEDISPEDIPGVSQQDIPSGDTPAGKDAPLQEKTAGVFPEGIPSEAPQLDLDQDLDLSQEDLIDLFYTGTGQTRISDDERERARKDIRKLRKTFSLDEIRFAIEWTLKPGNTKGKPRSFSMLHHTTGQAVGQKEQYEKWQAEKHRQEMLELEERNELVALQQKRDSLDAEGRRSLREQAEARVRHTYDPSFITEQLIIGVELEILKEG